MTKPASLKFPFSLPGQITHLGLKHFQELSARGKMIRPYLCELGFFAANKLTKPTKQLTTLQSLIEAFHNFCLLQDDCMDNASRRHNLPTTHCVYEKSFVTSNSTAKWIAITVSDLVFFNILKIFHNSGLAQIPGLEPIFYKMIITVTEGQAQDLAMRGKIDTDLKKIINKHLLKTADYSIYSPFAIGYRAGGGKTLSKNFYKFAEAVGLAFQIQDDLLDYDINTISGKDHFLDFSSGTPSFVSYYLYALANKKEKTALKKYFGLLDTREAEKFILNLKILEPALNTTKQEFNKYYELACVKLNTIQIPEASKKNLRALIDTLIIRKS